MALESESLISSVQGKGACGQNLALLWPGEKLEPAQKKNSSTPSLVPRHFDTEFMSLKKKITDLASY